MGKDYQICQKTIMDTSDPNIVFDENGISDYYHNYVNNIVPNWHTDEQGYNELMKLADLIKKMAPIGISIVSLVSLVA